jgi:GlpG protein
MIGTVPSEVAAQRLSNYLLTIGVEAHVEESATGAWQVWIEHDDDLDKGKAELDAFIASPNDPRYGSASAAAEKIRKQAEKDAERRRRNFQDVRTSTAFSGIARHSAPVAIVLIVICVGLFVIEQVNEKAYIPIFEKLLFDATPPDTVDISEDGQPVYRVQRGAMFDDILHGQVWRIVTPMLLHGSVLHVLFNMMWLWRLGQVIEGIKGSLFFGLLVLALAAMSCVAQAGWYEVLGQWHVFIGMSGVNAGLLGYAWMKRKYQPYERIGVTDQEIGLMIGWLVICSLGVVGNIANAAHWGGLVIGMLIGVAPTWLRRLRAGR